jgi:hypothetical protein
VFNPKISGIAGGIGFILSFLIGIISGAGLSLILIRALLCAAGFFILITIAYAAISMYMPELFENQDSMDGLGVNVDISVGEDANISGGIAAAGDGFNEFLENPMESGENMDSLSGNTLDHDGEEGYTEKGKLEEITGSARPVLPTEGGSSVEDADLVDVLPDLDFMSGAFGASSNGNDGFTGMAGASGADNLGGFGSEESATGGAVLGGKSPGKSGSGKKGLGEDFNVQEMASAIQTILKRENKG